MLRVITLLTLTAVLIAPTVAQVSPATGDEASTAAAASSVVEIGRRLTEQFYQGKLEEIHHAFSTEMKEEFPLERLTAVRNQVLEQLGPEVEVLDEQVREQAEYMVYRRLVTFEKRPTGKFEVIWTVREDDWVAGFFIRDASAEPSN